MAGEGRKVGGGPLSFCATSSDKSLSLVRLMITVVIAELGLSHTFF
jgi:hypothetical protein